MKLSRKKPIETRRTSQSGVPPRVFSYYARGTSASDQNMGRREQASNVSRSSQSFKWAYLPSYIALLAILIAVVYSTTLQPNPKIVLSAAGGTVQRDSKVYEEAVQTLWKKSLFNRSKLTVSTGSIKKQLQQQFGELSSVNIELPLLGRRPTVILKTAQPALQLISSNGSFYLDNGGKVMARTTEVLGSQVADMVVVRDETGARAELGKAALPKTEVTFLNALFNRLKTENVAVESITLPTLVANEADVRVTGQTYYIKFSIESDPRQATGTYLAAKAKLDADGHTPKEYIDIRVEEKVFYR